MADPTIPPAHDHPLPDDDEPAPVDTVELLTVRQIDKGWPLDETPLARSAGVGATVRGEEAVGVVELVDVLGDRRYVQVTQEAAWDLLRGLADFLWQTR